MKYIIALATILVSGGVIFGATAKYNFNVNKDEVPYETRISPTGEKTYYDKDGKQYENTEAINELQRKRNLPTKTATSTR